MDSRETRDWAREAKFLIDASIRPQMVEWSRANLEADGHGAGVYADEYTTASLYFETNKFDVYPRQRVLRPQQVPSPALRTVEHHLPRTKVPNGAPARETSNHGPGRGPRAPGRTDPDPTWPGYWFHRGILLRRLQPLIQMSYDRVAASARRPPGPYA